MADKLVEVAEDSARGGFFLMSGKALATFIMALGPIFVGRLLGPELMGSILWRLSSLNYFSHSLPSKREDNP